MAAPGHGASEGPEEGPKMPDLAALQNFQSMDWLLKKERIFLLAQFWQQRAALAENEVHSLKEQLDTFKLQKNKLNLENNNSIDQSHADPANNINNNNNVVNEDCEKSSPSESEEPPKRDVQEPCENGARDPSVERERIGSPDQEQRLKMLKEPEVSKLVEDISRLQAALSGVKEATAYQMHALEEQLEFKNRLIHRLELKLENTDQDEVKREIGGSHESRGPLEGGLGLPQRSLEALFFEKKSESENKVPTSDFGTSLSHFGTTPFPPPLRHHLHPQLATSLAPPPLMSPLQPLAPHPPPGTPFHHLLGTDWRKSYERLERPGPRSGDASPESSSAGAPRSDRSEPRDSPSGEDKCPTPLPNGFPSEGKSPYHVLDTRSPFKDELQSMSYKFEDRITGDSLIPKGDPMEARLQEILRFNMEKYCHQNLDTLHISRRVRELLSIHNIGQRLFAKYILGLSQGTVSELLSKPKMWEKLTEKGRDSYRKMHAWALDDGAIFLLKSLIPKRGTHKDPLRPSEETVAEERIQHILNEASRVMTSSVPIPASNPPPHVGGLVPQPNPRIHTPNHIPLHVGGPDVDARSTDSKSPSSSTHSPSPMSRESRVRPRKDSEDVPQDKMARLYQEELLKLMARTQQDGPLPVPRDPHYSGLLFPFLGQPFLLNRGPEDMKLALDAYHHEMSKFQGAVSGIGLGATGMGMGGPAGLGVGMGPTPPISMGMSLGAAGHNDAQDLSLPKRESRTATDEEDDQPKHHPPTSPFSGSRPKPEAGATPVTSVSPLSNLFPTAAAPASVSSSGSSSGGGGPVEEGASNVASPLQRMASITNSLVTAPSLASNISMNQKNMKAVLPPITQQQFDQYASLNTEDIVKKIKEQLSQYSISQRLFGESVLGLSQGSVSDLLARPKPWHMLTQKGREPFIRMKMFLEDDHAVHKLVASQYKIAPEKLMRTGVYGYPPTLNKPHHIKLPPDLPKTVMESHLPPLGIPSSMGLSLPPHPHPYDTRMPLLDPLRKTTLPPMRVPGPVAPSVYEMAALTQDLDTQVITTKIKEALLANNIGQKLFGEAVLGLSQGSVSELLSKPKPWHMLSIKGREPFIRMQLWLNDPHNLEKLQTLKNERREATKRRRGFEPPVDVSQDSYDMFQPPSPSSSTKKARVLFSEEQKEALRLAYTLDPYPNLATIEFLSQELQISTRTITNWFHNHRMRLKQQSGSPERVPSPPRDGVLSQSQVPFEPLHFRLLLSQRLMELRKEKGLPPSLPGLGPGLPSSIHPAFFSHMPPFSMANLTLSHPDRYSTGGLDLSMKNEHEGDDSNVSYIDEDSNLSGGLSPSGNRSEGEEYSEDHYGQGSSPAGRSSRRKPAVPQWVNPSWAVGTGENEREVINGVCVMQTDDYSHTSDQETVLIEPASVEESRRSLAEGRTTPEESTPLSPDVDVANSPSEEVAPVCEGPEADESSSVATKTERCDVNGEEGFSSQLSVKHEFNEQTNSDNA